VLGFCESKRMRRGIEPRMELADNYRSVQISIITRRERGKRVESEGKTVGRASRLERNNSIARNRVRYQRAGGDVIN
jgi:hypothetical protein